MPLLEASIYALWIMAIFAFGVLVGWLLQKKAQSPRRNLTLSIMLQLDATQPIKITAKGRDKEGNEIDLSTTDLTITAEATEGNFGEVNDAQDTFNPGDAGAKGVLKGSVTVDGQTYEATTEVELVAGGLASLELEFAPVPEPEPNPEG